MITEDYVNFETTKLLKEKGFDLYEVREWVAESQDKSTLERDSFPTFEDFIESEDFVELPITSYHYPRITLQTAMKWLEEVHHILVVPDYIYECTNTSWVYKIFRLGENGKPEKVAIKGVSYDENNNPTEHIVGYRDYEVSYKDYATRGEAEEEGIRYVLENLI